MKRMWSRRVQDVSGEKGLVLGPCFMHSSTDHNKHVSSYALAEFTAYHLAIATIVSATGNSLHKNGFTPA